MSEFTYSDDLPAGWRHLLGNDAEDSGQQGISAFAFDVAQSIEDIIQEKVGQTLKDNKEMQAMILNWYTITQDEKFAKYFGIQVFRNSRGV